MKLLLLDDLFEDDVKVEATFRQENHVEFRKNGVGRISVVY